MKKEDRRYFKKRQRAYLVFKRFCDISLSFLVLLVFSWFLLIIYLITKCTSKGPGIFKQRRVGRNMKTYNCYKFRSMRIDAPHYLAPSEMQESTQQSYVTKWGKFMRKTSLDELPQLFNILKGDMSFIGPRPATEQEVELNEKRESYTPRVSLLRPGLSGLAQVKLKRQHDPLKKAELDAEYVKNVSFSLDTKLFFKTAFSIFGSEQGR